MARRESPLRGDIQVQYLIAKLQYYISHKTLPPDQLTPSEVTQLNEHFHTRHQHPPTATAKQRSSLLVEHMRSKLVIDSSGTTPHPTTSQLRPAKPSSNNPSTPPPSPVMMYEGDGFSESSPDLASPGSPAAVGNTTSDLPAASQGSVKGKAAMRPPGYRELGGSPQQKPRRPDPAPMSGVQSANAYTQPGQQHGAFSNVPLASQVQQLHPVHTPSLPAPPTSQISNAPREAAPASIPTPRRHKPGSGHVADPSKRGIPSAVSEPSPVSEPTSAQTSGATSLPSLQKPASSRNIHPLPSQPRVQPTPIASEQSNIVAERPSGSQSIPNAPSSSNVPTLSMARAKPLTPASPVAAAKSSAPPQPVVSATHSTSGRPAVLPTPSSLSQALGTATTTRIAPSTTHVPSTQPSGSQPAPAPASASAAGQQTAQAAPRGGAGSLLQLQSLLSQIRPQTSGPLTPENAAIAGKAYAQQLLAAFQPSAQQVPQRTIHSPDAVPRAPVVCVQDVEMEGGSPPASINVPEPTPSLPPPPVVPTSSHLEIEEHMDIAPDFLGHPTAVISAAVPELSTGRPPCTNIAPQPSLSETTTSTQAQFLLPGPGSSPSQSQGSLLDRLGPAPQQNGIALVQSGPLPPQVPSLLSRLGPSPASPVVEHKPNGYLPPVFMDAALPAPGFLSGLSGANQVKAVTEQTGTAFSQSPSAFATAVQRVTGLSPSDEFYQSLLGISSSISQSPRHNPIPIHFTLSPTSSPSDTRFGSYVKHYSINQSALLDQCAIERRKDRNRGLTLSDLVTTKEAAAASSSTLTSSSGSRYPRRRHDGKGAKK
ncbi:hypothetical protein BDY19DRAFT_992662, partial [Irpex rosettiformis]